MKYKLASKLCELFVVFVRVCSHASELKVKIKFEHIKPKLQLKLQLYYCLTKWDRNAWKQKMYSPFVDNEKLAVVTSARREDGIPAKWKTSTGNKLDSGGRRCHQKCTLLKFPNFNSFQLRCVLYISSLRERERDWCECHSTNNKLAGKSGQRQSEKESFSALESLFSGLSNLPELLIWWIISSSYRSY